MATNQRQVSPEYVEVIEEFLADGLSETQTNEPGRSRNTLSIAGPLIPGSATVFEDENDVPTFSRGTGFPCNATQMGRLEPRRITISNHSYSTEAPGPSNFGTNYEHSISVPSVGQNQHSFEVSSLHQAHQHSSMNFPNSGQICSTFGQSNLAENVHSYMVSDSPKNQQLLVDTFYPGQPFGVQAFDQTEPSSTLSFHETQDSIMVSSLQVQPSLGYTSSYQSETPFGISREDHNSLVQTTSTSANTHDAPLAIPCQPSTGLSPSQSSHNQHSTFSATPADPSCELRLPSYPSTSSKPLFETDTNSLERHYSRTHSGSSFKCNKCKKVVTTRGSWKRHYQTKHDSDGEKPSFACNKCGKVFTTKYNSQQHELNMHPGGEKPSFVCIKCGKALTRESTLKQHQLIVHSKSRLFECKICGRGFKRRYDLRRHQLTHSKVFTCNICGRSFNSRIWWERHQLTHSNKEPFKCNKCDRVFPRREDWKQHYRTHYRKKPFMDDA